MAKLGVIRVPEWSQYDWLRHGFSTRTGGVSTVYAEDGAVGELNLGWTKEDDPAAVAENRRSLVQTVAGSGTEFRLVTIRQVHGKAVQAIGSADGALERALETSEGKAVLEGDGLATGVPGVMLGIQTADCVPVLLVDVRQRVVAGLHAGWRGTAAGIVQEGVAAMATEFGSKVGDMVAAIGPSIGACCYGVGEQVRGEFEQAFGYADELFSGADADGVMHLDLWKANRRQLLATGIDAGRVFLIGECTGCGQDAAGKRRYFSHRVEKGMTGRMMSVVGVGDTPS